MSLSIRSEEKGQIRTILPWIVCFFASLFFAYELLQMHVMNALSPMLMRDLKLNGTEFGYLSSTYLLADVIFLLPAGIILDRFSVRKVILTALLICILGTFGFCQVHTFAAASICHFISGIGNAFCFLSCMMLAFRWFPERRRAFVVGLMVTMGMLGGFLAQGPFSMLAEGVGWRRALFFDGIIGILIFILIFIFVRDAPGRIEKKGSSLPFWEGVKRSILNRQNVCCALYTGLMNLPLMVISAVWGTLFLVQVHQIPLVQASFIVSMICLGTIVGSPFYGWIADRFSKRRAAMFFGAVASLVVISMIILIPHPGLKLLTILFFALGFLTSSQVIGYPLISASNPEKLVGTSMGVAAVIIMLIAGLLQPFSGAILDLSWNGIMQGNAPLYARKDFMIAFALFPVGFILALLSLRYIKEPKSDAKKRVSMNPKIG